MAGKVFLIGAGPGDPQLLTYKAGRALACADVVLVDDLVNRGCLAHVRSDAKVIDVGKRAGCKSTPQAFIQKLMIRSAQAGRIVARLKGGDPFVFGRGGEELQALAAAGIEAEIIPGITAGIGVPAMLGIPVTHRDVARGVTFITGHTRDGAEPDWQALVRSGTTLVVYMGLSRLEHITRSLIAAGMRPDVPACVIVNGTLGNQREVIAPLFKLFEGVAVENLSGPGVIVIGEVVGFAASQASCSVRKVA